MVILVHLINNWQMNPHRKRTLLAALLLSTACIFAVTAAHADEPQVKDGRRKGRHRIPRLPRLS